MREAAEHTAHLVLLVRIENVAAEARVENPFISVPAPITIALLECVRQHHRTAAGRRRHSEDATNLEQSSQNSDYLSIIEPYLRLRYP